MVKQVIGIVILWLCVGLPQAYGQMMPKEENGRWGVVDGEGHWVAQPVYKSVWQHSPYLLACIDDKNNISFAHGDGVLTSSYAYNEDRYEFLQFENMVNTPGETLLENVDPLKGHFTFDGKTLHHKHNIVSAYYRPYQLFNKMYFEVHPSSALERAIAASKGDFLLFKLNDSLYYFRSGLHYGVVKNDGSFLIAPRYQQIHYVPAKSSSGRVEVHSQTQPNKFVDACKLFPFKREGLWGYMNQEGQEVIPARFISAHHFNSGLAAACEGNKFGYIDMSGEWVIMPRFKIAFDFNGEVAPYYENGLYGMINKKGQMLLPATFQQIKSEMWHFTAYHDSVNTSLISRDGEVIHQFPEKKVRVCAADSFLLLNYTDSIEVFPKGYVQHKTTIRHLDGVPNYPYIALFNTTKSKGLFNLHTASWIAKGPYSSVNMIQVEYPQFEQPVIEYTKNTGQHWLYEQIEVPRINESFFVTQLNGHYFLHRHPTADSMSVPNWLGSMLLKDGWEVSANGSLLMAKDSDLVEVNVATQKYRYHSDIRRPYPPWRDTFTYQKDHLWGLYSLSAGQLLPRKYVRVELQSSRYYDDHFATVKSKNGLWAVYDMKKRTFITPFLYDTVGYYGHYRMFKVSKKSEWYWMDEDGNLRPRAY